MTIVIEKHINLLKTEACKYWSESDQHGLIHRSVQALEQQQAEINDLQKRKIIDCRWRKLKKGGVQLQTWLHVVANIYISKDVYNSTSFAHMYTWKVRLTDGSQWGYSDTFENALKTVETLVSTDKNYRFKILNYCKEL